MQHLKKKLIEKYLRTILLFDILLFSQFYRIVEVKAINYNNVKLNGNIFEQNTEPAAGL